MSTRVFTLLLCGVVLALTSSYGNAQPLTLSDAWEMRHEGRNREALAVLAGFEGSLSGADEQLRRAYLGGVLAAMGRFDEAGSTLAKLLAEARLDPAVRAVALMEQGSLQATSGDLSVAATAFAEAARIATATGDPHLAVRAQLNALRSRMDAKLLRGLDDDLRDARQQLINLGEFQGAGALWLSLAELTNRAVEEFRSPREWRGIAYSDAEQVRSLAEESPAMLGWASGFKGHLYEQEGQLDAALKHTRSALFQAQLARDPSQLFRWHWQEGRLLAAQGQSEPARHAYARAVELLDEVRGNFVRGSRNVFKRLVEPVYAQYADLLLQQASAATDEAQRQTTLGGVRDLLETLKHAEVEDYFSNECVVEGSITELRGDRSTAILYPVLLDQRTELLVEIDGAFSQFSSDVGRRELTREVRRLRLGLERSATGDAHLRSAKKLYNWLLRPARALLDEQQVSTLVIIPEGALRTIPLASLHDGDRYLIEGFALATTPALRLTRGQDQSLDSRWLVGGLSDSVQGFVELPSVPQEVSAVSSMFPSMTIQNDDFQLSTVTNSLADTGFTSAHFATHGEFNSDYRKSFILTYDDRLTLNNLQSVLERRGEDALDLLVLSACQTAAGDDRAALGLAGVAVQSGARSALASLWSISDSATAALVEHFYSSLNENPQDKAASLRAAQLELLNTPRYAHPAFWAPYLLIGDWR